MSVRQASIARGVEVEGVRQSICCWSAGGGAFSGVDSSVDPIASGHQIYLRPGAGRSGRSLPLDPLLFVVDGEEYKC